MADFDTVPRTVRRTTAQVVHLAAQWEHHSPLIVPTVVELDRVLDRIAEAGRPMTVNIYHPGGGADLPAGRLVQLGVGHAERSFVMLDADGTWAVEDPLPPLGAGIWFDYGGLPTEVPPAHTRVAPATARRIAREFIASGGTRPTFVRWVHR